MTYFDCFLVPVPRANKSAYEELARLSAEVVRAHGALSVTESWLDGSGPSASSYHADNARQDDSAYSGFLKAAGAGEGDTVVLSWVEWHDKATRDAGMEKVMSDPRMQFDGVAPVFDGRRLIAGGFRPMLRESGPSHTGFAIARRIAAPQTLVWKVLVEPNAPWAEAFGGGTQVNADWARGSTVVWRMGDGALAAVGEVEEHRPQELLRLRYRDTPTLDASAPLGDYRETFKLIAHDAVSSELTLEVGASPAIDDEAHKALWDKVLEAIKARAEAGV